MRHLLIFGMIFLAIASTQYAEAQIINSTNYKIFMVVDSAGGHTNSTNYFADFSVDHTLGLATGVQYRSCLGYICVEYGPLGQILRVTFLLELNVSGTAGDVTYVDNQTSAGLYTEADISKFFGCVEDQTITGNPVFGVAFAGSKLNYIRLNNATQTSIRMSQNEPGNRFVLPVTTGGCTTVRNKMPITLPLTAFVPFSDTLNSIELIVSYPIDLVGNFEKTGKFTLVLEKNETNKIIGVAP